MGAIESTWSILVTMMIHIVSAEEVIDATYRFRVVN